MTKRVKIHTENRLFAKSEKASSFKAGMGGGWWGAGKAWGVGGGGGAGVC